MNYKSKKTFAGIVALLLLALILTGALFYKQLQSQKPRIVTIEGTVLATSNGCFSDGGCAVILDSQKTIITGCGLSADSITCATYDQTQLHIGDRISARVIKDGDSYSLGTVGNDGRSCPECTINKL